VRLQNKGEVARVILLLCAINFLNNGENIVKIGEHFPKLSQIKNRGTFFGTPCRVILVGYLPVTRRKAFVSVRVRKCWHEVTSHCRQLWHTADDGIITVPKAKTCTSMFHFVLYRVQLKITSQLKNFSKMTETLCRYFV